MESQRKNTLLKKIVQSSRMGLFAKVVKLTADKTVIVSYAESFADYRQNIRPSKDLAGKGITEQEFNDFVSVAYIKKTFAEVLMKTQQELKTKGLNYKLIATNPNDKETHQISGSYVDCMMKLEEL